MRLNLRLHDPRSGRVDHVVVEAEAETPVADVVRALNAVQPGELFLRGTPLAGQASVVSCGLRDGDLVTVGKGHDGGEVGDGPRLVAVGGPLSGGAWALSPGGVVVGRSASAGLRLDDSALSREHFRISVTDGAVTVEDLGSTNGTFVDGRPTQGPAPVEPGAIIEAGASVFEVRAARRGDADVHPDESGGLAFNRPARIRPALRDVKVTMPTEPTAPEPHAFPWVQVLVPVLIGALGYFRFGPWSLLFAAMGPVLAVSTNLSNRKRDARRTEAATARYRSELAAAEARIGGAAERELHESREQYPDPAAVAAIATGPGRRLWERRAHDPDALLLRVGVGDRAASIAITGRGGEGPIEPPRLQSVPVTVDLAGAGVVGVAGPTAVARAVGRWLLAQLAVLRSPRDLRLVVLTDPDAASDWEWVRWLPHARDDDPGAPAATIGHDRATREERVKELVRTLEARLAAAQEHRGTTFLPAVVVLFDGIRALRFLPGVPRLLREGPAVGIHAVGLDLDVTRLAEEGRAQVVIDEEDPTLATLEVDGVDPVPAVLLDQVDAGWADGVARALAPVRDTGAVDGEAEIPRAVRLVDLEGGIDLDRPAEVVGRWTGGGRTTEALVGVSSEGPFRLDLQRDGPHALVAGTTGSGKSEFLQTLVVSLALGNRPTSMSFVLIDYKGGSAFAECAGLPHTVGLVTNLDGHLTERALESLDAELERREQELKTLGAPDVGAAWETDGEAAARAGLGRLVIVIDEFAELVQELPEFVAGLIRVARVGRSLGVHLVLATQRPSGVVSPEMRANTGLRVALRMEDREGSTEVLEAPQAAAISRSTPGRAFLRSGGGPPVEFQTARVAARRRGVTEGLPPPRVEPVPWGRLGYPLRPPPRVEATTTVTDLQALVSLIRQAASRIDVPLPRSPWLAPLPDVYLLPPADALVPPGAGEGPVPVVIGLEDLPSTQQQRPVTFDVVRDGHLLIAGSPRSGRSTALRTLAGSLARSVSPEDVHLFGLDFGNGALLGLTSLPHCGAVVTRSEPDRVERLVDRLAEEVAGRQELLARLGHGDVAEQRQHAGPGERLPYLVVLLDRFEGFLAQFPPDSGSAVPGTLVRLVREGAGAGLRLVVAGDRSLLTDRVSSLVEDRLVLRLADRDDYRIASINPRTIPEEVVPGRAFRAVSAIEVQLAMLDPDGSGQAQGAALRRIGAEAEERWPASGRRHRPLRVDALPAAQDFEQAWSLPPSPPRGSPLWALVGVGGDELTAYGVDLSIDPGFVVAGPSRSGRSTALVSLARSLVRSGARVVALCPRPSPLEELAGTAGVLAVLSGIPDPAEVAGVLGGHQGPLAVLVDDAEALARQPADDVVRDLVRGDGRGRLALVVAGPVEELKNELKGTIVEARRSKAGLLLSPPSTLDGDLVGLRLPRNLVGRFPPGRGVLALRGEPTVVQVPR